VAGQIFSGLKGLAVRLGSATEDTPAFPGDAPWVFEPEEAPPAGFRKKLTAHLTSAAGFRGRR
jgi:hypothetical protein